MKRVSAKMKLMLWTTLLLLLMAGLLIGLMFAMSDEIVFTNSVAQLKEVVSDNAGELEFDDGQLDIDDIDLFKQNVYTLLYSQEGVLLAGNFPEELAQPLADNETAEVVIDDMLYYIYDSLSPVEDSRSLIWVRGIIPVDAVAATTTNILQIALLALPVFVILGAIGCYFIAKSTFRPIDKIVGTAEVISESENLSLRINLKSGSAEIYKLADTFDKMFERLESAFEAEKQFTSDVSHELRTPTAVILAQCEYAMGENVAIEDKEEALETVHRQATKMSNLITNLLNLIRLDRGVEKIERKRINLSELVREICEEHKLVAPPDLKLTYDVLPNVSGEFDAAMITRLLTNLLNNSFRYRKENGSVEVVLAENDAEIVLSVKDNGMGIAAEHQERIWHRFYQVDSSRTASQNGSMGLGLSIVAQIAKLHSAKIELESEYDKGSLFIVKFPK